MATTRSLPSVLAIAMLPLVGLLVACGGEGEGPPESPRGGDGSAALVSTIDLAEGIAVTESQTPIFSVYR